MSESVTIQVKRLRPDQDSDIPLPRYMTHHAAGMDLHAAIDTPITLAAGQIARIATGLAMAIPDGYEVQIRPRSGLAAKHGVTVINAPGTIDSDYRGEVQVALVNLGAGDYTIQRGERVAQMLLKRVFHAELRIVEDLSETERNTGGFGHTGA